MTQPTGSTNPRMQLLASRILGVERDEIAPVIWSFAYFFCVLSSYYILRPVRETMAVGSGPQTIPWLFFGTFVTMMLASPVFGWVASRYARRDFLPWIYLFFISHILIFWFVFSLAVDRGQDYVWLGRTFFVWLSVFNLFVVSVFWSFMADIYSRQQGRRLFGIIAAGGSFGALLGGASTSMLVVQIGFQNLLPIAAGVLLMAIVCIAKLKHWVASSQAGQREESVVSRMPLGGNPFSGMTQVLSSRYFSAIATSSVIASILGTALYMFAAELVALEIPDANEQTRFFSNINNWINAIALIGQLLVVKHVVGRFGIGISLSLLPIVSIAGFVLMAVEPTLGIVAFLTILRRGLGFGFSKPTTDMLYSVVTPEEKYKTKNFIDTAVYRAGDLVGTWSVKALTVLGFGISAVSLAMLPFAVFWAMVAIWLGREYRRRAQQLRGKGVL